MPKGGEDRWFNINAKKAKFWTDPSDTMAQGKKLVIDFFHAPSKNSIAFKAFITEYSETYEVNYEEQEAFGRIDSFAKYRNTKRRVSLGWETVAASKEEAEQNMRRCTELIQMMYPSYENHKVPFDNAERDNPVIASEPVFRVRFANWLVDSQIGSAEGPGGFEVADTTGVWCRITNLQYTPDLAEGSFDTVTGVFPKVIKLSCAIIPYMPEGYWDDKDQEKKKGFNFFPFGYAGIEIVSKGAPGENDDDSQSAAADAELLDGSGNKI